MKKIIVIITIVMSIVGSGLYAYDQEIKAEEKAQKYIDAHTVIAYQVSDDGAMQITFADGTGYYFEDMEEIRNDNVLILNYNFLTDLKDCYSGHNEFNKVKILKLHVDLLQEYKLALF